MVVTAPACGFFIVCREKNIYTINAIGTVYCTISTKGSINAKSLLGVVVFDARM
jgi:hypothetical protein